MAESSAAIEKVKDGVEDAADEVTTNPAIEWLVRLGYDERGVIYIVVGVLAVQLVLGAGGETADKTGAIAALGESTLGKLLLVKVAVGLVTLGLAAFGVFSLLAAVWMRGRSPEKEAEAS